MTGYSWKPIEPLSPRDHAIDLAMMRPLYESWRVARARIEESSPASFQRFSQRLIRSLSIETGIIERLYDLDRGTTEALIQYGFAEDLVSRTSTDIEPSHLIDILRDHESAIQLVMDCIGRSPPLTKGVVHELHSILTRHQETTTAMDQFGNRVEIPLLRGKFKEHPNNPKRPDGQVHEYCPPVHVDAEMEHLLSLLEQYRAEDPILVSAWFHHRFTQIHPYQDGNGRVGRALTTMILLAADLLPVVIDRDTRAQYIEALERADAGDLEPLVTLLGRLERAAILQALSVDVDAEITRDRSLTAAAIESLAAKLERKRDRQDELHRVDVLARSMRDATRGYLQTDLDRFAETLSRMGHPQVQIQPGGPDEKNAHWYRREVIESGQASKKFIKFSEPHYFVKATVGFGTDRLVFVVSFHHVGRELSGIAEATAFALIESYENDERRELLSREHVSCTVEPFVITWNMLELEVTVAFRRWLDTALAIAIKEFGDRL
jgi:fido (protein-threonine AMPylation protein)